jgi:hypothetical protein
MSLQTGRFGTRSRASRFGSHTRSGAARTVAVGAVRVSSMVDAMDSLDRALSIPFRSALAESGYIWPGASSDATVAHAPLSAPSSGRSRRCVGA